MWAMFFIIGGVWFWLLSIVVLCLLLWEIHEEKPIIGLFTVGFYLALIHLFGDASVPSTLVSSPWILYLGIPIYVVAGVVWGLIKWSLYTNRHVIEYKQSRRRWLLEKQRGEHPALVGVTITEDTTVPTELRSEWKGGTVGWANRRGKPSARNEKWKIITWMCYWPFSMLWTVLDEPWRYIYEVLSSVFQRISDKLYSNAGYDVDTDLTEVLKEKHSEKSDEAPAPNDRGWTDL